MTGQTLAQRTIDALGSATVGGISAKTLAGKVTATSAPDTVLIDVGVHTDTSPERARDIANALSDEFVVMAKELENPREGRSARSA